MKSKLPAFSRHRELMDQLFNSLFRDWSVLQLGAISLCAGICEELLFRGAIQGGLSRRVNLHVAVLSASVFFGAFHLLTWTYGMIAAVIGAYLGLLWI